MNSRNSSKLNGSSTPGRWVDNVHSPFRSDKNPSFSVMPDDEDNPGAWKDHATGESGSMADLANRLGLDPRISTKTETTPAELSLETFCQRRRLGRGRLEDEWKVRETIVDGRPALVFPTRLHVDRVKFLDDLKPKQKWASTGGRAHWYGFEAAQRLGGDVLHLVNGEPSVWAAVQSGVAAVCTCAGEGAAVTNDMIEELAQTEFKVFRVVYDLDQAGRAGAHRIAQRLRDADLDAVALELPAHLGKGGDVDDLHRLAGDDGLAARLDQLQALPELPVLVEGWRERQPLPRQTDPVPTLPLELIPETLQAWLADAADRPVLPLELVAVPAMVGLGGVVGRALAIRPEPHDDWLVPPNLWGGIIQRPGLLKSYCIDAGLAPLNPLITAAHERYQEDARLATARKMVLEDRLKAARRQKGGASEATVAGLLQEIEECRAVEVRLKTHDSTIEKLGELLAANPRGLILVRDELAGWLRGFDKQGREGEREFFLESWAGTGSYVFDRIGRGTINIEALCLSVIGSIQPGKLRAYIRGAVDGGWGADGLLQRLQLLVWPDRLDEWQEPTRWPNHEAKGRAFDIYAKLHALDPSHVGARADQSIPYLMFAPEAQDLFKAWRRELEHRLRGEELLPYPAFESHLAKYRSLMPSIALLLHIVEVVEGSADGDVSLYAAQRAAAWCEYLEVHARKVYSVELAPERAAAHALAERIKRGSVQHRATVRDLYRPHWEGLRRPEDVEAALEYLQRLGWLKVTNEDTGGRPSCVVELHPDLRRGHHDG